MVSVYKRYRRRRDDLRWIGRIIAEAKAEQAASPMSPDEIIEESRRLVKEGARITRERRAKQRNRAHSPAKHRAD